MKVRTESKTGSFPYWFNKKSIVGLIVMSGCTGKNKYNNNNDGFPILLKYCILNRKQKKIDGFQYRFHQFRSIQARIFLAIKANHPVENDKIDSY